MSYPSKWTGSNDMADTSGTAKFRMDGIDYQLRLNSFEDYQRLDGMLEVAFKQGKHFAAMRVRSHVIAAMTAAEHSLSI